MTLYYAPGACSLADHIALLEAGASFETEAVDLRTKRTASARDFRTINPKGYVPALELEDGQVLTENVAVLDWISERYPRLRPSGLLWRTRQLEMLAFISTEIHRAFKPMWHAGLETEKEAAREAIAGLLDDSAGKLAGDYLFGDALGVADCYLFVMLRWAEKFGVATPEPLIRLQMRLEQRPSVRNALAREAAALARRPENRMDEEPASDEMSLAELQSRLRDLGYYDGPAEGRPWIATIKALEKFQNDNGLPVTSRPDSATAARLRESICY